MTSLARLSLGLAISTLTLVSQGCGSSTENRVPDASPEGVDGRPDAPASEMEAGLVPPRADARDSADRVVEVGAADLIPAADVLRSDIAILSDGGVEAKEADAATPSRDVPADFGSVLDGAEIGSGETGSVDASAAEVLADTFSCSTPIPADAGISRRMCYDFTNSASAGDFIPEAGTWIVSDGLYTANGPDEQVTCPPDGGTVMTASVLAGLSAKNVRVHARMTSIVGVDKVLVLRSHAGGNRIEVDFRANYMDSGQVYGGDVNVADLVNCVDVGDYISSIDPNPILIPHAILQPITVDLQLIDQQLTIAVDGRIVFDGVVPLSTAPGSVGFAVFRDSVAQFDDFQVDVLD